MEDEGVSFKKKLQRHKDLMGSLIHLLPQFLVSEDPLENSQRNAQRLQAVLGHLKGPMLKIAQLFGNIPDILPEPYVQAFQELQSHAPSMGWPFVRRRMVQELGPYWENHFISFDKKATFAASLGQVHRARLTSGQEVAVKLQYPNLESTLSADLDYLKLWMKVYGLLGGTFNLTEAFGEVEESLWSELDYRREANWYAIFEQALWDVKGVHLPSPYLDLSTKKLLVLSWVEGEPLLHFKESCAELRNTLARHLFEGWYTPFYTRGLLNGDPHMGNYRGFKDGSIALMDFGCVREFSREFVQEGVIGLYRGLLHQNKRTIRRAYEAWGFKNLTFEQIDVLNKWALFLYGPVLKDKRLKLIDLMSSQDGQNVAQEVYRRLKTQGGFCVPKSFVFMDRVAVGLGSVFMHLNASLNWHELFEEVLAKKPMWT